MKDVKDVKEWSSITAERTVLLGNRLAGKWIQPYSWKGLSFEGWECASSLCYVCPVCLEKWAILPLDANPASFEVRGVKCKKHGGGLIIPRRWDGSIEDWGFFHSMPHSLAIEELLTLADMREKELKYEYPVRSD